MEEEEVPSAAERRRSRWRRPEQRRLGLVTNHHRRHGDATLNPSWSLTKAWPPGYSTALFFNAETRPHWPLIGLGVLVFGIKIVKIERC